MYVILLVYGCVEK